LPCKHGSKLSLDHHTEHQYTLGDGHVGKLSGSIGFSMYPFSPTRTSSLSWEQVITVADHAAYAAKRNGRNAWVGVFGTRKCSWEELTRTNVNLPMLAQQGIVEIKSSLEKIEEYIDKEAVAKA
jgi:predicted signal transduction protein with EAL and GGDEF domain